MGRAGLMIEIDRLCEQFRGSLGYVRRRPRRGTARPSRGRATFLMARRLVSSQSQLHLPEVPPGRLRADHNTGHRRLAMVRPCRRAGRARPLRWYDMGSMTNQILMSRDSLVSAKVACVKCLPFTQATVYSCLAMSATNSAAAIVEAEALRWPLSAA